jgi:hypothetical protein
LDEPWSRRTVESAKAYAAFIAYLSVPLTLRNVQTAWRHYNQIPLDDTNYSAPAHWKKWMARNQWLERAMAYDEAVAARELDKWERRREAARERDWEQANRLRDIVDGALPNAEQFFRRQTTTIPGTPTILNEAGEIIRHGTPAQTIITVAFDVTGLTRVLVDASKMQRLVVDEPTDNINNLSGAALDAVIERALAQRALEILPNLSQAADGAGATEEYTEADDDGGADGGME